MVKEQEPKPTPQQPMEHVTKTRGSGPSGVEYEVRYAQTFYHRQWSRSWDTKDLLL